MIKWSTGCLGLIKRPLALIKRPLGAIKWSAGDKTVYGPPRPAPRALPWLDKKARKWSTGDKMVYGLPSLDKTAIGLAIKWSAGDKTVYGPPPRPSPGAAARVAVPSAPRAQPRPPPDPLPRLAPRAPRPAPCARDIEPQNPKPWSLESARPPTPLPRPAPLRTGHFAPRDIKPQNPKPRNSSRMGPAGIEPATSAADASTAGALPLRHSPLPCRAQRHSQAASATGSRHL